MIEVKLVMGLSDEKLSDIIHESVTSFKQAMRGVPHQIQYALEDTVDNIKQELSEEKQAEHEKRVKRIAECQNILMASGVPDDEVAAIFREKKAAQESTLISYQKSLAQYAQEIPELSEYRAKEKSTRIFAISFLICLALVFFGGGATFLVPCAVLFIAGLRYEKKYTAAKDAAEKTSPPDLLDLEKKMKNAEEEFKKIEELFKIKQELEQLSAQLQKEELL